MLLGDKPSVSTRRKTVVFESNVFESNEPKLNVPLLAHGMGRTDHHSSEH